MKLQLMLDGRPIQAVAKLVDGVWSIVPEEGDGFDVLVKHRDHNSLVLSVDGRIHRIRYARRGRELHLHVDGRSMHVHPLDEAEQEEIGGISKDPVVRAPMPGRVLELLVAEGDSVTAGQAVIRVEAMKMEVDLEAPLTGVVAQIHVKAEQLVEPEAVLLTLSAVAESES